MQDLGKLLFVIGLVVAIVGGWLWSGRGPGLAGPFTGGYFVPKRGFQILFPSDNVHRGERGTDAAGVVFSPLNQVEAKKLRKWGSDW
jgi:hypothetical protein